MRIHLLLTITAAAALAVLPSHAQAQSATSDSMTGTAAAEVIEPGRLFRLRDLRFGAFASPRAAARLTISPTGVATGTGEIAQTMTMTQPSAGRGQAIFRINGTPNRAVVVQIPNTITITRISGTQTMRVTNITSNMPGNGQPRMDANGIFLLNIGGRLRVNANQAAGNYTGQLTVRVIFQ